jgi:hypothetical protein
MRRWHDLLPVAGPAVGGIKWKLTWVEWRVVQEQAMERMRVSLSEAEELQLMFIRWLYQTGRLTP